MQRYELAGMVAALGLMALIVGACWPGKRVAVAFPQHATVRR